MTKLVYPDEGIYILTKDKAAPCITNLNNGSNSSDFSVPYGFGNRNYLYGLRATLTSYKREFEQINDSIKKVDNNIENLSTDLYNEAKSLLNYENNPEKEREKYIK